MVRHADQGEFRYREGQAGRQKLAVMGGPGQDVRRKKRAGFGPSHTAFSDGARWSRSSWHFATMLEADTVNRQANFRTARAAAAKGGAAAVAHVILLHDFGTI